MSRLIDAEIAYDKIAEQETSYYMDMDGVQAGLDETPTVDAVPVVRCKECKYAEKHSEKCYVCRCRTWKPMIRKPDFYCADGERGSDGEQ